MNSDFGSFSEARQHAIELCSENGATATVRRFGDRWIVTLTYEGEPAAQQEASEDNVARLVRPTDAELAERDERNWQERRNYLMSLNAEALNAIWHLHAKNPGSSGSRVGDSD